MQDLAYHLLCAGASLVFGYYSALLPDVGTTPLPQFQKYVSAGSGHTSVTLFSPPASTAAVISPIRRCAVGARATRICHVQC